MSCPHAAGIHVCRKCGVALLGFVVKTSDLKVQDQKALWPRRNQKVNTKYDQRAT